ncbi:MAG: SnoaL-like domain-containing protein [Gammaproteobacteria bacterium]|nr:ester cyclase [Gammaproteobacteria bacterium]NNC97262.1 SnoaL-like domain-containing protein [Gammaproteobacteria bacterium]NNM14173.1 SnoaL-like domain-containing protein [Gammaproteobacteria bacterium]
MNTETNRALVQTLRKSQYNFDLDNVYKFLRELFIPEAVINLSFPFETLRGVDEFFTKALKPLHQAIPDLERRDTIVMSGPATNGSDWVGCCGYFTGTFSSPWLDIPHTGHQVSMRFHEFYRIENNRIVEMQALWDIPELMMQANAWPMSPSLGREWHVPGPATQDGLMSGPRDEARSAESQRIVHDMCDALGNHATGGVDAMGLPDYWHPKCSWYGPSGIGTARGIAGFRNWHQIPFLNALPDRVGDAGKGNLFADGDYVAFTAWPGMYMTVSGDGWLGIAPSDKKISMRSLDFWRVEKSLIRENWVLIDLLHVYHQLGVDVLGRMREFNKAKTGELSP